MHDIKWIRQNAEAFDAALNRRGLPPMSVHLLKLDEEKRSLQTHIQNWQSEKNKIAKEIGMAKGKGDQARVDELMLKQNVSAGGAQVHEENLVRIEEALKSLLESLPNLPAADVPGVEEEAVPSFMPRSPQRTWSHRYLGRKVMLAFLVVLALLLTSQWLFTERDRLAANIPTLRPLLGAGCAVLGCTLSAPRQIESIAIDSSAFTQVKSGVYNLSLSLRNGAAIDLAAPALELTLTDMRDQALVRRVLLPGEYNARTLITAGAELVVNVPIAVRASPASDKISGYKLLAFYP